MKKILLTIALLLTPVMAHAIPVPHPRMPQPIYQGPATGLLTGSQVYELTIENEIPKNVTGPLDVYFQLFDQATVPVEGDSPIDTNSFKVPNLGSAHIVFKVPQEFRDGIGYCISLYPFYCYPNSNSDAVSGYVSTDY